MFTCQDNQFWSSLYYRGSQRVNVSKHVVSASDGFLCRGILDFSCPKSLENLFGYCGGTLVDKFYVELSSPLKLLATLVGLVESSRTWSSLSFFLIDRIEILTGYYSKVTYLHHHRSASDCMYSQIPLVTHPSAI